MGGGGARAVSGTVSGGRAGGREIRKLIAERHSASRINA